MARELKVGTKSTCRTCGQEVAWLPPNPDWPYSKHWIHTSNKERACDPDQEWLRGKWAEPTSYCTVTKADYSGPCHSPAVDDELFMCGPHAKKEIEYRQAQERRSENSGLDEGIKAFLEPLCQHVNDFYDLDARMELYDWSQTSRTGRRYTGYVVVNPAKLVELLKEIEDVF